MGMSRVSCSRRVYPGAWRALTSAHALVRATVMPPQEPIQGDSWWTDYQAVSYQLVSKHGNRDQFANMVKTCQAAGVGVIVGEPLQSREGLP